MRDLGPLIHEACSVVRLEGAGPKPILTLEQKVTLLLLKIPYDQSNRRMAGVPVTFSLLSGLDVSYQTVERLYSDPAVAVGLENLHTLMLRRPGVRRVEATGGGTGFARRITQHYATTATKEGDRAKESPPPSPSREGGELGSGRRCGVLSPRFACWTFGPGSTWRSGPVVGASGRPTRPR